MFNDLIWSETNNTIGSSVFDAFWKQYSFSSTLSWTVIKSCDMPADHSKNFVSILSATRWHHDRHYLYPFTFRLCSSFSPEWNTVQWFVSKNRENLKSLNVHYHSAVLLAWRMDPPLNQTSPYYSDPLNIISCINSCSETYFFLWLTLFTK